MNSIRRFAFILIGVAGLYACGTLKDSPKYQLSNDVYKFGPRGSKYTNAYVFLADDTVSVFSASDSKQTIPLDPSKDYFFIKNSFDLDVMTGCVQV